MKLYKSKDVTAADGAENTEVILTSSTKEKYRVLNIAVERMPTDGALDAVEPDFNDDEGFDLLVYVEREKILDFPTNMIPRSTMWIPLDLELPVGHSIEVGFRNATGGALTRFVTVQYEVV
ncbi:hypothetical protein ES703_120855 [subsurface metagenome]